jgi:transcriptional regulator with XRE-family HTH domain
MTEQRAELAQRRVLVGHSQESLAEAIKTTSRSIRAWENGSSSPSPRFRPELAAQLKVSLEELERLLCGSSLTATDLRPTPQIEVDPRETPEFEYLFAKLAAFSHLAQPDHGPLSGDSPLALPDGTPLPLDPPGSPADLDLLLLAPLAGWAATDNRIGPHPIRGLVTSHFGVIRSFLDSARGFDVKQVAYIAARYAELGGWLSQDAGDLAAATTWTKSALDAARLSSDHELESYILMRQSNIATDRGDARLAIALADAASQTARSLSGPLHVLALRQRAHAHTALGDSAAALRDAELARDLLLSAAIEPNDLTGYCTPEYLDMESASCLVDLGHASEAISILETGLQDWNPSRRRDLGLCLARLALAYAHCREAETSFLIAREASRIATATRSFRTLLVLQRVGDQFEHHLGSPDHASQLRAMLGASHQL